MRQRSYPLKRFQILFTYLAIRGIAFFSTANGASCYTAQWTDCFYANSGWISASLTNPGRWDEGVDRAEGDKLIFYITPSERAPSIPRESLLAQNQVNLHRMHKIIFVPSVVPTGAFTWQVAGGQDVKLIEGIFVTSCREYSVTCKWHQSERQRVFIQFAWVL